MNMRQIIANIVHKVPILNYPKPKTPENKKIAIYFNNIELHRMGAAINNRPLPEPIRRRT